MKNEYLIGMEQRHGSMASIICTNVSHNSWEYWVYLEISEYSYRPTIYICKDSPEGRDFKEWISNPENQNKKAVTKKCLEILLSHNLLTADDILNLVSDETDRGYERGYSRAQYDIRKALGF